jgi:hypothetical protein
MKLLHIICLFANLQKQINYSSNWKIKTVEYFKAMNALLLYMIFFIQNAKLNSFSWSFTSISFLTDYSFCK